MPVEEKAAPAPANKAKRKPVDKGGAKNAGSKSPGGNAGKSPATSR